MIGSILVIAVSAAALTFAAAESWHYAHLGLALVTALLLAYFAWREWAGAAARGANATAIAGIIARHMGLVWAWGTLVLVATYVLVLDWREWWQFTIGFAAAAGLCLLFSRLLRNDAEAGGGDQRLQTMARYLAIGQLAAMIVTMIGLLIDGKMTRFLNPRYTDWAGNNVFFFGALALAIISFSALRANAKTSGQQGGKP